MNPTTQEFYPSYSGQPYQGQQYFPEDQYSFQGQYSSQSQAQGQFYPTEPAYFAEQYPQQPYQEGAYTYPQQSDYYIDNSAPLPTQGAYYPEEQGYYTAGDAYLNDAVAFNYNEQVVLPAPYEQWDQYLLIKQGAAIFHAWVNTPHCNAMIDFLIQKSPSDLIIALGQSWPKVSGIDLPAGALGELAKTTPEDWQQRAYILQENFKWIDQGRLSQELTPKVESFLYALRWAQAQLGNSPHWDKLPMKQLIALQNATEKDPSQANFSKHLLRFIQKHLRDAIQENSMTGDAQLALDFLLSKKMVNNVLWQTIRKSTFFEKKHWLHYRQAILSSHNLLNFKHLCKLDSENSSFLSSSQQLEWMAELLIDKSEVKRVEEIDSCLHTKTDWLSIFQKMIDVRPELEELLLQTLEQSEHAKSELMQMKLKERCLESRAIPVELAMAEYTKENWKDVIASTSDAQAGWVAQAIASAIYGIRERNAIRAAIYNLKGDLEAKYPAFFNAFDKALEAVQAREGTRNVGARPANKNRNNQYNKAGFRPKSILKRPPQQPMVSDFIDAALQNKSSTKKKKKGGTPSS